MATLKEDEEAQVLERQAVTPSPFKCVGAAYVVATNPELNIL